MHLHSKGQQAHHKKYYDHKVGGIPCADLVMLYESAVPRGHCRKIHSPWKGPYKVVKLLGETAYRIQDCANSRKRKVVYFNHLKPMTGADISPKSDPAQHSLESMTSDTNLLPHDEFVPDEYEYYTSEPNRGEENSPQQPLQHSTRTRCPVVRYDDVIPFQTLFLHQMKMHERVDTLLLCGE